MDRTQEQEQPDPNVVSESLDGLFDAFLARLDSVDLTVAEGLDPSLHAGLLERLSARHQLAPRYSMGGIVGRGGMGEVHRVQDMELGRPLAMKILSDTGEDCERVARFLEEAQVTGQLDHPGIVPIHELGVDGEGRPFFTMQLVRGRDLEAVLNSIEDDDSWDSTRVLQVLLRACEAVAFAHNKGVLHRDLKPANVMVGRFGEVYVMDWGLAKVLGRPGSPAGSEDSETATLVRPVRSKNQEGLLTREGDVLGTPSYMSPEQARGEASSLDQRTDVYSLGAMLYHALAGKPPYHDEVKGVLGTLTAVRERSPRSLEQIAPGTPAELIAICEQAMARDRTERYPGAMELAADLRAFLDGRVVTAHRTGALIELRKWIQRNRLVAIISFALASAVSIGFIVSSNLYLTTIENARGLELSLVDKHLMGFDRLLSREPELWPPMPEKEPALRLWVEDARHLLEEVPRLLRSLESHSPDSPKVEELRALQMRLSEIDDTKTGLLTATVQPHGLSVLSRLELASNIEWDTVQSPEARAAWSEAVAALAQQGIVISPQVGLLPLGPDPSSGLWEFAHMGSGQLARRDSETGQLLITAETGLVFVLIPGGDATLGSLPAASELEAQEPYHVLNLLDYMADVESPLDSVELDAYFLSKFEMTQGQWLFCTGEKPSANQPGQVVGTQRTTALHPVENISWHASVETLARFGWQLPTEAQWEYACRAGTTGPWWTGIDVTSLRGKVNIADRNSEQFKVGAQYLVDDLERDDGYAGHAPVTQGAPNPFGLIHISGNVSEFCQDNFSAYPVAKRGENGLALVDGKMRIHRGGSFTSLGVRVRSSYRVSTPPTFQDGAVGIRPMRTLTTKL